MYTPLAVDRKRRHSRQSCCHLVTIAKSSPQMSEQPHTRARSEFFGYCRKPHNCADTTAGAGAVIPMYTP